MKRGLFNIQEGEVSGAAFQFFHQIYDELMVDDAYELSTWAAPPPSVVWDIGANLGLFSMIAERVWSGAVIHCWEPYPALWPHIEKNAPTAVLHRAAASPFAGQSEYLVMSQACSACMVTNVGDATHADVSAPTIVVDCDVPWLSAPAPDLIKMDCEGGEYDLLHYLPLRPSDFLVEFHGPRAHDALSYAARVLPEYAWRILWKPTATTKLLKGTRRKP